jgi:hypothetical protein
VTLFAIPTTTASDVERDRYKVADLDELNIRALFDHFTGDLMPEHKTLWGRRTPSHHVLIGPTNVGRDNPKNRAMWTLATHVRRMNPWAVV